jgi:transposase
VYHCLNNRATTHLHTADTSPEEDLLQSGNTQRTVAAHLIVSQSVILRWWNRFQNNGTVAERPRSDRPRSTMARDDHHLVNIEKRQRYRLNVDFQTAKRVRVTPRTVCNRIHAANSVHSDLQFAPNWPQDTEQPDFNGYETMALHHWTPVLFTNE